MYVYILKKFLYIVVDKPNKDKPVVKEEPVKEESRAVIKIEPVEKEDDESRESTPDDVYVMYICMYYIHYMLDHR